MARRFDNNVANYMSRASVNLGLNGLTECSVGCSLSLRAVFGGASQTVFMKLKNATGLWITFRFQVNTIGQVAMSLDNESLNAFPQWVMVGKLTVNRVGRLLFTWKRNAIDATDGIMYLDGQAVTTTFTANSYSAAFVLDEVSNGLFYGIRSDLAVPLSGDLGWMNVWNRQLTSGEALADYVDPKSVTSGLLSSVEVYPDDDRSFGGSMTVNGTLEPVSWAAVQSLDLSNCPKPQWVRG